MGIFALWRPCSPTSRVGASISRSIWAIALPALYGPRKPLRLSNRWLSQLFAAIMIGGSRSWPTPSSRMRENLRALQTEQRRALHSLPANIDLGDGILAVHGTPDDDCTCLLEETLDDGRFAPARRDALKTRLKNAAGASVVLCGHSHQQNVVHGPGGCLILNPGSVGCPVFADIPIAANLEYRSPHARYAVLTKRNGNWRAELLALEYDWASASARALENGRPEWAMALLSGVVG